MFGPLLAVALLAAAPPPEITPTPAGQEAVAAFERGRRLYETGTDMAGARAALDEAIRLRPDYAEAYLYRAMVTQEDHGLAGARADYEFALRLAPDYKDAHYFYGVALAEAGELAAAEERYRRALELDPDFADVIYMYGKLHRDRGELDQALELGERHAQLKPQGTAHHVMGEIWLEKGDHDRAAEHFRKDLEVDASCYESRVNLAGILLGDKEYEEAREQYEISLTYHPADAAALSGLGRAYLALGDYERAVGTLRSAEDLAPDDQRVADALADARARLKEHYRVSFWSVGWPFVAVPSGLAAALAVALFMDRRKRKSAGGIKP